MTTLYLLGDKSQPMHLEHGLVIAKKWHVRDGHGTTYASTPDESKARGVLARMKKNHPMTAWTVEYGF